MISFIVIGKNVRHTIATCLDSIAAFVKENAISDFEVIYVDSSSTDESVSIAHKHGARTLLISGEVNAAIGRNVGARVAQGDVLFFVDGDMELLPDFYPKVFTGEGRLVYPFLTGYWVDRIYDGNFIYKKTETPELPSEVAELSVTGGLILIEKDLWFKVGEMDERLNRSQDHDLGLRLKKRGFPVRKFPYIFVIHHTSSYFDGHRIAQFFGSTALLSQGILMRKHLFDPAYLKRFKHTVAYAFLLLLVLVVVPFNAGVAFLLLFSYLCIQFARALNRTVEGASLLGTFVFYTFFSLYALIAFLFYFPASPSYHVQELD